MAFTVRYGFYESRSQDIQSNKFNKLTYLQRLRTANLTHAQYRVLVTILTYSDPDGANAYPGFAKLAKDCRMSRGTVSKSLKALKRLGWLREVSHGYPSKRRRTASVFELRIPKYVASEFPDGNTSSPIFDDPDTLRGRHEYEDPWGLPGLSYGRA